MHQQNKDIKRTFGKSESQFDQRTKNGWSVFLSTNSNAKETINWRLWKDKNLNNSTTRRNWKMASSSIFFRIATAFQTCSKNGQFLDGLGEKNLEKEVSLLQEVPGQLKLLWVAQEANGSLMNY